MFYFTLPSSPMHTYRNIRIDVQKSLPPVFLSNSLCLYMNDIKEKISTREKEWDIYKKYTNPYEYIHSVVPQKKKSISKYKPISRSYFKMLEMIAEFKLDQPSIHPRPPHPLANSQGTMRTFHLAEGPGGFIEAICNKRANPADEYVGMTIVYDITDDNVPAWHKTGHFLSHNPNVNIEYGCDGTGDLLHINNFDYCVRKYGSSMDLITADGGFDFSKDFNRQEISITNLLWGQVCYAVCLQKQGGNFVLKIFDVFYEHTAHILYILSGFYDNVHICKLKTSRIGNSEKYIVCKGFRFSMYYEFYAIIRESFSKISREKDSTEPICMLPSVDVFAKDRLFMNAEELYIWKIVNVEIPRYFTKQIEDINAVFGQQQIENIHFTLSLIDKHPKQDRIDQIIRNNITKCINWCIEYSIPYNNFSITNVFDNGGKFDTLKKYNFAMVKEEPESEPEPVIMQN